MGSVRALIYLLSSILLFSAIFTAGGQAPCGPGGCAQQAASQDTLFSAGGISISSGAAGDFATISTPGGSSMKIEQAALQKLQNGERVRLFVRKKKAAAPIDVINATPELLPDNPVNASLALDNSTNETLNTLLPSENATNETIESQNAAIQENPSNESLNMSSSYPENQTLSPSSRGIVGEFILFYQKFMLMMAPPPAAADGGQPADPAQPPPDAMQPGIPSQPDSASSQVDLISELPNGDTVVESGMAGLASIADSGADEVYLDYGVSASLSDTIPLIGAGIAQSQLNFTGSGITICLLDTGVDFSEPSLNGVAISGYDFVNNDDNASDDSLDGHGTRMAAIIHAVAPNATILAVKVLDENGTGYASGVVAGIDYCRQQAQGAGIRIISMSLGGGSFDGYCNSDPVAQEANLAVSEGMFVDAAAGNNGGAAIAAPACGENVTAVASTTKQDTVSYFSGMNGAVDLLAPGEGVTVLGASYSGTSVSAAHVSGAAALLLQSDSSLSPAGAEARFKATGTLIEYNGANYSRINVYNAILDIPGGLPTNQTANDTNQTGNYTYQASTAAGNVSCGVNLDTPGAAYTMNNSSSINWANCFNVTAVNVTLDCNGFSITGNNSTNTYGIYSNMFNTTVKNCNISNFATGIFFNGSANGTIDNTSISTTQAVSGNDGYGINLINNSNYTTITNSGISNAGSGIYINPASNVTIDCKGRSIIGRNISNGIYSASPGTMVKNCIVSSFIYDVYFDGGATGGLITNTSATTGASGGRGIYLASNSNIVVANSTSAVLSGIAIYLSGSSNNTLSNINASTTTGYGIYLSGSSNNTLSGINATATATSGIGIDLASSSNNNTLSNLTATATSGKGIMLESNFNSLSNLTATATDGKGIYISSSSNNTLSSLNAATTGSAGYGIYLAGSNNNTLSSLNATASGSVGVAIGLYSRANSNVLSGINARATNAGNGNRAIVISDSSNNTISSLNATAIDHNAISVLSNANNNTIANSTATATTGYGIYLSGSSNTTIANSTATTNNGTVFIITSASASNTIRNTTLVSLNRTGLLLNISSDSGSNTFCLDNFTNTSGLYVNDTNGTNYYNCTYGGISQTQGNIWYNVINGSVLVGGANASSIPGLYIGTSGAGVPYTNTSSAGKFSCN
ncbi:MAG: S8 family serine peptidase, partial [Candidatus Micrarchaeota archaeon]|nr:S8 family serine peptidase [Candidatus Micrarchaeota archaeon]